MRNGEVGSSVVKDDGGSAFDSATLNHELGPNGGRCRSNFSNSVHPLTNINYMLTYIEIMIGGAL
jgi:hypothetical protein